MNDTFLPGSGFDTYESQDKVLMQMDGSTEAAVAVRILQQQGFAVVGAVCCCLWANSTPEIWLSWRRSSSCKTTFFIVPCSGTQKRHRFCGAFCCG